MDALTSQPRTVLGRFNPAQPGAAGMKVVAEWFPARERGVAGGIYQIGASFGAVLAPVLVAWAVFNYSWRAAFFVAGGLYVLTGPPLLLAQWLFYGYVVSRLAHFAAYFTGQIHEVRATLWTIGSVIILFMTIAALTHGIGTL